MKTLCAVAVLSTMLLAGCGNSELKNCQQENQTLQSNVKLLQQELLAAKEAVSAKDKTIQDLQSENVQMQTKAMESIKTMMEKQAAKDQELKDKFAVAQKQAADLQMQLDQTKAQLSQTQAERDQAQQQLKTAAPAGQPAPAQ